MQEIHKILQEIDLSDKEIAIYMALVELGSAPASVLGKRTAIHRSTAQYTCEQLHRKGIVESHTINGAYIYSIDSADKILDVLYKQKQKLMQTQKHIESVIPQLNLRIQKNSTIPSVVSFEGKNALDAFYKALVAKFEPGQELLNYEYMTKEVVDKYSFSQHVDYIIENRTKKNVPCRIIATYKDDARVHTNSDLSRKSRYISPDTLNIPLSDTYILLDSVCSMVYEGDTPFGFIINNTFTAQLQRGVFELAWQQGEEF